MAKRTKKKKIKRASRKSILGETPQKSIIANNAAHWKTYKSLQKKVDKAWDKLRADVRKKASPSVQLRSKNNLLLLLGECNYMARECMQCANELSKKN